MQGKIGQLQILVDAVFVLGAPRVYRTYFKEKSCFHVEMGVCAVGVGGAKSFIRKVKSFMR